MLRKKNKTIAEIAIRLRCGSDIRSSAVENAARTFARTQLKNQNTALIKPIPYETK